MKKCVIRAQQGVKRCEIPKELAHGGAYIEKYVSGAPQGVKKERNSKEIGAWWGIYEKMSHQCPARSKKVDLAGQFFCICPV